MNELATEMLMVGRVAAAMLLGGCVGLEREMARRAAGLRTHMLIAGSAALIVGLGRLLAADFHDDKLRDIIHIDPVRLIEAVVAAVGFVGAGTILRRGGGSQVHGLTTAASLLMVAGLGIAVALDHFVLAVGATILCIAVLFLLGLWEQRMLTTSSGSGGADSRPRAKRA